MIRSFFLFAVFALSLFSSIAQQAELVLPIIHGRPIKDMGFSQDGQYFVSCSSKSIKLWEAATGNLLRTIDKKTSQGFKTEEWEGGFSVVGLSSDGSLIISGRNCGATYESSPSVPTNIQVWEAKSGKILKTLQTFETPTCIYEVAISADQKYALAVFAAGDNDLYQLQEDAIIRIWDLQSGRAIKDHPGESAAWTSDSKQFIAIDSNEVSLIDITSGKAISFTAEKEIKALGISSDNEHLYGFSENYQLLVWNIPQQKLIATHALGQAEESFYGSAFFSEDGSILTTTKSEDGFNVRQFYSQTGEAFNQQHFDIRDSWGVSSPDARSLVYAPFTDVADFRAAQKAVDLTNGKALFEFGLAELERNDLNVVFETKVFEGNYLFSLKGRFTHLYNPIQKKMLMGDSYILNLQGDHYFDQYTLEYYNFKQKQPLWKLNPLGSEVVISVFSEDGKLALVTDKNELRIYDQQGNQLSHLTNFPFTYGELVFSSEEQKIYLLDKEEGSKIFHLKDQSISPLAPNASPPAAATQKESAIWGVESRDGVSLSLIRKADSEVAATILPIGEEDWVVATPSGLFDASPNAMKSLHYVYEMELIGLEQLKERYYEPGLLEKILGYEKGEIRDPSNYSQLKLYPKVTARLNDNQLNIELSERRGGIGKLSLFINGKEVSEDINPSRQARLSINLKSFAKYYFPGKANKLALRSFNEEGWLKSQAIEVNYRPDFTSGRGNDSNSSNTNDFNADPHLYALIVGTADYSGEKLDLAYPDKDAVAIYQALQAAGKALFNERTDIQLLSTDTEAGGSLSSKSNIQKALQAFAQKAQPADILVVYFAGHGVTYGQAEKVQFYYLTKDIGSEDLSDPEIRNKFAVSTAELTEWLTAIPAQKQVMMLDACNSGKVVESLVAKRDLNSSQIRAIDRMKDRTGMFVLSGSAADKVSYEASQYGQGLLTYSLLQGMKLVSASNKNSNIDVMQLFQYSRDRVPELAKGIGGIQTPMLAFPNNGSSFDIGLVNEGVHIPVAEIKPIFIRNVFQDENAFDDVLGLSKLLEDYFKKASNRGAKAPYIYVDVNQFENAYSIKGRYTTNGEEVAVRGALFKGAANVGGFELSGSKNEMDQLVRGIIREVRKMMRAEED